MDSTTLNPNLPIKVCASKLPIKRKNPPDDDSSSPSNPSFPVDDHDGDPNAPPFKFHRIWTESDEIRFLHGLLYSSSDGLSFPRDLNIFYAKFSASMSQPYTKSQLSEKLRRLRRKFRVISSRLSRGGVDETFLSPHDRSLFNLSKHLWHPDFSSTSPFWGNTKPKTKPKSNLVGVRVRFSPTLPSFSMPVSNQPTTLKLDEQSVLINNIDDDDAKLSEVNILIDDGGHPQHGFSMYSGSDCGGCGFESASEEVGELAAKTVINAFDQSLREVRTDLLHDQAKEGEVDGFEVRWRQQRVAEFDVMARRLRLVLDPFIRRQ